MDYVAAGARISKDGRYRYRLWREWRLWPEPAAWRWLEDEAGKPVLDGAGAPLGRPKSVLFVMLNPSTADGDQDDPTIRRCVGFARAWGYDRVEVVNLFAYRATDPDALLALNHDDDPVGPDNGSTIRDLIRSRGEFFGSGVDKVVCAWGNLGGYLGQDETVLGWLGDAPRFALKLSKDGHPGHPLYLPASSLLIPFDGAAAARRSMKKKVPA